MHETHSTSKAVPKVSVVTIFLNEESFIHEAIESVFSQSFVDWELLLVDDGSSDGSTALAREVAKQNPDRVRYLEHEHHANLGMSASRNLALRHARGTLAGFLDADDVWLPNKLADQVAIVERHPDIALVYSPALYWHSWDQGAVEVRSDETQDLGVALDSRYEPPILIKRFLDDGACTPCGELVSIEAARRVGGFESSFRGLYEDQVLACKLAAQFPVYVSSKVSYKYRQHSQSHCAEALRDGTVMEPKRQFLLWLQRYLEEIGLRDAESARAWKRQWAQFFGWKRRIKNRLRPVVPERVRKWLRPTEASS